MESRIRTMTSGSGDEKVTTNLRIACGAQKTKLLPQHVWIEGLEEAVSACRTGRIDYTILLHAMST